MEIQTLRINLWTQLEGEEGEDGMNGERHMETYITMCKIDSHWEFAIWHRELKPGLNNNLEGWDGEEIGGGGDVQVGGDMGKPMVDSFWHLVEAHTIL